MSRDCVWRVEGQCLCFSRNCAWGETWSWWWFSFAGSVWFPALLCRSEEEKSSMADFRWCVWEWIRFTEIALCGGNEDPRGMCKQPSNYPKVLPSTASGWDVWMQKGFIWRAFFQRSEILLVLARNTLIRVFTQESVLLSLNHMHLWGKSQVMGMLILLVEISFERKYLVSQKYSTNSYYFWEMKCLMGAKKEQSSYTGKLQQLDLTISKQDFHSCYCFFVEKRF